MRNYMTREQIQTYVEDVGSDCIGAFGGKYDGGYHVQQNPPEFSQLIRHLMDKNTEFNEYIEIGAAAGGATRVLWDLLDIKKVHIIDNNQHPKHGYRKDNLKNIPHDEFVGDSHSQQAIDYLNSLNVKFDLAFIDGDHSYAGVRQDTLMMTPYMKPGCLVIFHDIGIVPEVRHWADDIKRGAVPGLIHDIDFVNKQGIGLFVWRG